MNGGGSHGCFRSKDKGRYIKAVDRKGAHTHNVGDKKLSDCIRPGKGSLLVVMTTSFASDREEALCIIKVSIVYLILGPVIVSLCLTAEKQLHLAFSLPYKYPPEPRNFFTKYLRKTV